MQKSDTHAIWAADQAFYSALCDRDIQAMARVWADTPYVVCIGPRSKVMNVGFDSVKKYWEWAFDFFSRMTVSKSDAQVQTDGQLSWVVGVEHAQLQVKNGGEPLKFDAFSTHVLEKVEGRWLLVSHHPR